jgi:toxin-antitoxin system PIN domain toxin
VIAVDTNILVYAHRRESRFHGLCYDVIASFAEGRARWSIPWPCVYEFFSVVTNTRIWKESASTPAEARAQIDAWFKSPSLLLLNETDAFSEILLPIVEHPRVRGPIIHDARIAALCLAHGVEELLTKDRDFHLFPKLVTRDPTLQ